MYPTNATLRAELADALADAGKFDEAVDQGDRARALDDIMPHADKKMLPDVRTRLNENMPRWRAKGSKAR